MKDKSVEYFVYWCGRYTVRATLACAGFCMKGCGIIPNVAKNHKINRNSPTAVTENVFECLKYID